MSLSFKVPARIRRLSREPGLNGTPEDEGEHTGETARAAETANQPAGTPDAAVELPGAERLLALEQREQEVADLLAASEKRAAELELALRAVQEIARKLEQSWHAYLQEAEMPLLKLAFEIAKKVIHREVQSSNDIILYAVRELIHRAEDALAITVVCHPEDLRTLESNDSFTAWLQKKQRKVAFRAEPSVARGGALLETDFGKFDGTLETQLAEIERQLLYQVTAERSEN